MPHNGYDSAPGLQGRRRYTNIQRARVGYHPASGLWWCGNPHNRGARSRSNTYPLSRSPASLSLAKRLRSTPTADADHAGAIAAEHVSFGKTLDKSRQADDRDFDTGDGSRLEPGTPSVFA